jgi:hypothetical protein
MACRRQPLDGRQFHHQAFLIAMFTDEIKGLTPDTNSVVRAWVKNSVLAAVQWFQRWFAAEPKR